MYLEASNVINNTITKKGSLKNLVFSSTVQNKKALYALSCETLRYRKSLLDIAMDCGMVKDKRLRDNETLVAVLLYEHLLGKGVTGKYKALIHKHKSSIHSRCERIKLECRVVDLKQALQILTPSSVPDKPIPKYVRINTLLGRKEDIRKELQRKFQRIEAASQTTQEDSMMDIPRDSFVSDEDIPNLLRFHPAVELHHHPLYLSGKVIIQDKASCFPAYILDPPKGSVVIDCCAAPGNKTTHLATIMENSGKIYAFDKDPKRFLTLQSLVKKAGATCVQAECRDFLSVNAQDKKYEGVNYILVDPSCSGSGMVNRLQQFTDDVDTCSAERLKQLSKFQITILKHALSFPSIKKVVYSTCSIHDVENEEVVEEVYAQVSDKFEIETIMPGWKYRGRDKYEHGRQCLRMSYEDCQTNGFFVAGFVRKDGKSAKDAIPTLTKGSNIGNSTMHKSVVDDNALHKSVQGDRALQGSMSDNSEISENIVPNSKIHVDILHSCSKTTDTVKSFNKASNIEETRNGEAILHNSSNNKTTFLKSTTCNHLKLLNQKRKFIVKNTDVHETQTKKIKTVKSTTRWKVIKS